MVRSRACEVGATSEIQYVTELHLTLLAAHRSVQKRNTRNIKADTPRTII